MIDKERLRKDNGIFLSDAVVAVLLVSLFSGIIVALITNTTYESTKIKLNSQQLRLVTEIFEYVDKVSYDQVTEQSLIQYVNNSYSGSSDIVQAGNSVDELTSSYKVRITVRQYGQEDGKMDLIKIVTVNIENTLANKEQTTEISRIRKRSAQEVKTLLAD